MYNAKLIHYCNGDTQTRLYSRAYCSGYIATPRVRHFEIEPFTGTKVIEVFDFDDIERKKERSMAVSRKRALNMIYELSRANVWTWFVTLTFSPDKVDRYSYEDCGRKLKQWLDNTKRRCSPDFKYIIVPERHKDGAYHFHGLFANCEGLEMVYSGHDDKNGKPIYNIGKYRLGFTTTTKVVNNEAVCKYITKYVTKDLIEHTKGKKHFWASRNLSKPIKQTYFLDAVEKMILSDELAQDCTYHKIVTYQVGLVDESIVYFENKNLTLAIEESE